MAQGSRKTWGSEGPAFVAGAASLPDDSAATAPQGPARPSAHQADAEVQIPNAAVTLDEANDLLVINEVGSLLPSTRDGWADAVVAGPAKLSRSTASWAKEVLGTETESAKAENERASQLSKDTIERDNGEDASPQTVDWIDW